MIHSFEYAAKKVGEVGSVEKSDMSIAIVRDLPGATVGEGVTFESGVHGMVSKLGNGWVEVMVFGEAAIPTGEQAARTGEQLKISVGDGMLGDTFDALGHITSQEKEPSRESENRPVEAVAWSMDRRAEIKETLTTGVAIVDTVVPVAKGQRELVIGDQKTGKTHFLMQAVKTQARLGTICIIGLIGKEQREIEWMQQELEKAGVRNKCIIIAEPSSSSAARLTLVPFTAMTVAEFFRDQGKDSLVVLDDMSYHAVRYREMALLSDRFPGRDSYPSDIFYLHARLLERAGSFCIGKKVVTITCLPSVTTVDGDIAGYIQTNLMSMTDGHLYFDKNLFFDGVRPAVNIFLSVTRVGRQTQTSLFRELGQRILTVMSGYAELKRFLRFGTELGPQVKESIRLAHGLKELLKQEGSHSIEPSIQAWLLARLWAGVPNGRASEEHAREISLDKEKLTKVREMVAQSAKFDQLVVQAKKVKL